MLGSLLSNEEETWGKGNWIPQKDFENKMDWLFEQQQSFKETYT